MGKATESLLTFNAMTEFLIVLDGMGADMEAVGKLCRAAVELRRWGTSMELSVHGLTREEFDGFEGEERHYPINDGHPEWWSKESKIWEGGYDAEAEPHVEGRIWLRLYTYEPPKDPRMA